jgi:hypothetical protein
MKFDKGLMASTALAAVGMAYTGRGEAAVCQGTFLNGSVASCTVATAGDYRITALGGAGLDSTSVSGATGGDGGRVVATFSFAGGTGLDFTVGSAGSSGKYGSIDGGDTFVSTGSTRLVTANGGAGGTYTVQGGKYGMTFVPVPGADGGGSYSSLFSGAGTVELGASTGQGSLTIERLSTTAPVPVPPAGALLAGGLVSMAAFKRRKAKRKES